LDGPTSLLSQVDLAMVLVLPLAEQLRELGEELVVCPPLG
jgi:hypothetical protein